MPTALATEPRQTVELLTHSRMQCFKTCRRKHQFQYELGIRRERKSQPLRVGEAVHVGLDCRAKGGTVDEAILVAVAGYDDPPIWAIADDETLDRWYVERETVARLLAGYFWYYGENNFEVVASELSFELPIRNPDTGRATTSFRQAGKLDQLIRQIDGARQLAIMETKTCSEPLDVDSDYWKRLRLDIQISLYMLAARKLGYNVTTIIYNAIRKPTIEPLQIPLLDENRLKIVLCDGERVFKKDGSPRQSADSAKGYILQSRKQTPAEFGERLTDDITKRPEWYFVRREIPRLEADLEETRHELWQIQQTLRECQKHGRWYRNSAVCIKPYRCEYLDVCHNGNHLAENIPEGFVQVTNVHPELEPTNDTTDSAADG